MSNPTPTASKKAKRSRKSTYSTRKPDKPHVTIDSWQGRFIEELSRRGIVTEACAACGIDRSTAYKERNSNILFAEQWNFARENAAETLEVEAWRRAVDGVERLVLYKGEIVKTEHGQALYVREYSDALLTLLLKANNPNKFTERSRQDNLNVELSALSDAQLELLANGASLATVLEIAGTGRTGTPTAQQPDAKS